MKLLLLDRDFHHKNRAALYAYKNIHITPFYWPEELARFNLSEYDAVYSPTYPIDVKKYPNTRFIFGPHFSVFPDQNAISIFQFCQFDMINIQTPKA